MTHAKGYSDLRQALRSLDITRLERDFGSPPVLDARGQVTGAFNDWAFDKKKSYFEEELQNARTVFVHFRDDESAYIQVDDKDFFFRTAEDTQRALDLADKKVAELDAARGKTLWQRVCEWEWHVG